MYYLEVATSTTTEGEVLVPTAAQQKQRFHTGNIKYHDHARSTRKHVGGFNMKRCYLKLSRQPGLITQTYTYICLSTQKFLVDNPKVTHSALKQEVPL